MRAKLKHLRTFHYYGDILLLFSTLFCFILFLALFYLRNRRFQIAFSIEVNGWILLRHKPQREETRSLFHGNKHYYCKFFNKSTWISLIKYHFKYDFILIEYAFAFRKISKIDMADEIILRLILHLIKMV